MENLNPFEKAALLYRYLRDELPSEERAMVEEWLAADEQNRELADRFRDRLALEKEMALFSSNEKDKAWESIAARTGTGATMVPLKKRRKVLLPVAVVAVLCLIGGWLIWRSPADKAGDIKRNAVAQAASSPANPGKVSLTLANGSVIALDETGDGAIYEDSASKLLKKDGQLLYQDKDDENASPAGYNMIRTPVGRQYRVVLPDKSKVWLNATSSLRYPTAFRDAARVVELSGEAYFEVSKNKDMPFIVKAGDTKVEVVGTHFNVMAYPDEKTTTTTLLEGAVIVSDRKDRKKMKPGQEAVAGNGVRLADADLQAAVAWKQGFFHFENAGIEPVMRQLARWYDIGVTYEKGFIPGIHFSGIISRASSLQQVITMINMSGNLQMEIQGREVLVKAAR